MGLLLGFSLIVGVYTIWMVVESSRAQKFFEKFAFDQAHRGAYNMTYCMKELLNCWEVIKPDILCDRLQYTSFASACTYVKEYCAEYFGDQDNYYNYFRMAEAICELVMPQESWT